MNDITHDQGEQVDTIGRLKSFGVDEPWQSALLLPRRWDDFSALTDSLYEIEPDRRGALVARIASEPTFEFQKGPPRAQFMIEDGRGVRASVTLFGDTGQARDLTVGKRYLMKGKTDTYNGQLQFRLDEIVPTAWAGRARPVYPGKSGVIGPDLVRTRQLALLPKHMADAASQVIDRLSPLGDENQLLALAKADTQFNSIESLLWAAHLPESISLGEQAHEALERLAAADMLLRAREEAGTQTVRDPLLLSTASLEARTAALPYPLTDEQSKAVAEITEDLRRPVAMRRLLSGDVGTGKTAVYGTAVATAVDAGARCVVMLPNINLATQVFREMAEYWPDLDIKLVSGDTKKRENLRDTQVLVGTTALLNRAIGDRDLVVADEQHKFSKAQREKMAAGGGHLLEVSATSIPRSQALLQFGVMDLSMLTKGHVDKTLHTRLRYQEDRAELFQDAIRSIEAGHQLAVVYPLKENQPSGDDAAPVSEADERKSAITMYETWEKRFPGRVRLLHGQMSDQEKQDVIADMKADKADILISTTVIEVGLTLPRLRRLMVISADRHGLTGLHQLRGRLARHGGEGFFDLYIPQPKDQINPAIIERLSILEQTTDGFAVAEHDMVQRGYGELTGEKQSGKGDGLLLGRTLEVARLTEMTAALPDLQSVKPDPVPMQTGLPSASQPDELSVPAITQFESVTVFHGATQPFDAFNTPTFFTDHAETAKGFAIRRAEHAGEERPQPTLIEARVTLKSPAVISAEGMYAGDVQFGTDTADYYRSVLADDQYDSVVLLNTVDEGTVYVIKDSTAIEVLNRTAIALYEVAGEAEVDERQALNGNTSPSGDGLPNASTDPVLVRLRQDPSYAVSADVSSAAVRSDITPDTDTEPHQTFMTAGTDTQEQGDDMSDPKPAWELTREAWVQQAIARDIYAYPYMNDDSLRGGYIEGLERDWYNLLLEHSQHGRISNVALDDIVAREGYNGLREFIGVHEPGVEGYLMPDHRLWEKTYSQMRTLHDRGELGPTISNLRGFHRMAIENAMRRGEVIPEGVLKDYPQYAQAQQSTGDDIVDHALNQNDAGATHNAEQVETASSARGDLTLTTGERVKLPSGAVSSAVPKLDFTNERRSHASMMRMHAWLLENAITEAAARGDTTNLAVFEQSLDARNLSAGDIDSLNLYLFDRLAAKQIQVAVEDQAHASVVKPSTEPMPAAAFRDAAVMEPVKWFGSNEKATAWVARQSDPAQFEIVPSGNSRFEIFKRDVQQEVSASTAAPAPAAAEPAVHVAPTPVAAPAKAQAPLSVTSTDCAAEEAVHQPAKGDADAIVDQMMAVDAPRKPLTAEEYKANLMREQGAADASDASHCDEDEVDPLAPTGHEPVQPGLW